MHNTTVFLPRQKENRQKEGQPIRQKKQKRKRHRAQKHFKKAEVYYQQGSFLKALNEYKKAHKLSQLPSLIFNMGQCHRQLGNYHKALFFYKLFLAENKRASNKKEVLKFIGKMEKKISELKRQNKRKGRISIITKPSGAKILVDTFQGTPVGTSPVVLRLKPGDYIIVAKLKGHKTIHKTVKVQSSKIIMVKLRLIPKNKKAIEKKSKHTKKKIRGSKSSPKKKFRNNTNTKDTVVKRKETKKDKVNSVSSDNRTKKPDGSNPRQGKRTTKKEKTHGFPAAEGNAKRRKEKTRQEKQKNKGNKVKGATGLPVVQKQKRTEGRKGEESLARPQVASKNEKKTNKSNKPIKSAKFYKTWWFWTGISTSLALAGGAAATAYLTMETRDRWFEAYNEKDKKRGETLGVLTDGLWGAAAGVALAVTVGALVFHYSGNNSEEEKQTNVIPSCSGEGCGVFVQGRF